MGEELKWLAALAAAFMLGGALMIWADAWKEVELAKVQEVTCQQ